MKISRWMPSLRRQWQLTGGEELRGSLVEGDNYDLGGRANSYLGSTAGLNIILVTQARCSETSHGLLMVVGHDAFVSDPHFVNYIMTLKTNMCKSKPVKSWSLKLPDRFG